MAVAWIVGFGLASARMATTVDRRAPLWFVLGAALGPIAPIVLQTAPPGRCRTCGTPTRLLHRTCWWCHEDVRSSPASTLAIVERMSQRIAGAAVEPLDGEPLPEPERAMEPPKPFVIRSDAVRPPPFTLAGPSPRAKVRSTREPVRTPEVPVGAPAGSGSERVAATGTAAAPERTAPERPAASAAAAAPERPTTSDGTATHQPAPSARESATPPAPAPAPLAAPEPAAPRVPDAATEPAAQAMPASAPKAPSAPTHAATKAQPAPPAAVAKLEVPAGGPFVPASYHSASPARTGGDQPADAQRLLATAVFVAGSARLEPGRRYNLAIRSSRFLVLGPADLDPTAVVLDRDVADIEARSLDGRLVLSEPNSRSGLVLAFMGVAGPSTANLASMISDAAREAAAS